MACTDGSPEALRLLARNLSANSAKFLAERVLLRQLTWGDARHIAALQVHLLLPACCLVQPTAWAMRCKIPVPFCLTALESPPGGDIKQRV